VKMAERARKRQLGNPIPLRLDPETEVMIEALSKKRGESNQEVMRRLLHRAAKEELLGEFTADTVLEYVRRAVQEASKPFEERMAKLSAKASIAAATTMYTNLEVLGQLGRHDIREIHQQARKKAVAFVRSSAEISDNQDDDLNG